MVKSTSQVSLSEAPEELRDFFDEDELRIRVFLDKYALTDLDGKLLEKTPRDMWKRVAREIASVEPEDRREKIEAKFNWLLSDFKFVPGGRIMFGAGQPRNVTLLNCYVIPIKEDSLEGIFDWTKEAARTYSYGGGTGVDISPLRPKGAPVNNSAIRSTGSFSFMDLFSTVTGTIGQAGRRGALMITIRVDHPDIFDFIEAKKNLSRVNYANLSVRVTDEFMKKVEQDKEFTLQYENEIVGKIQRKVKAKDIWDKLVEAAWESAEPGVIFWDKIKRESTTEYGGMEVLTTNPCSEVPLEPYGCCCLGNVNLAQFVNDDFTEKASVDWDNLSKAVGLGVRFLDNVLDYNKDKHPLPQQKEASIRSRRIGIGFTGLGDMLIRMGLKYDTEEAVQFVDHLWMRIKNLTYETSTELAEEKGPFPAYIKGKHMNNPFINRLDEEIQDKIRESGLRNAALLTVPPVGSGSVLAGTSSGIEPIFSLSYLRKSQSLNKNEFRVYHPLVEEYMERFSISDQAELPESFITAHDIDPQMRVRMQAMIQRHIDHSISSTVNLPEDITVDKIKDIYFQAWKDGCKGITVYREGSRPGVLLTDKEEKKQKEEKKARRGTLSPRPRPKTARGRTFKMKTEMGSLFVTINEDEEGLVEVFANLGKSGSSLMAFTEAIGRLISLALRSGVKPSSVIDQLKFIKSSRPIMQEDGEVVFSVPDGVARALEKYIKGEQLKLIEEEPSKQQIQMETPDFNGRDDGGRKKSLCPACGGVLVFSGGCYFCRDCGYTKCD